MSDLVTAYEIPAAGSAEVVVLPNGRVGLDGADQAALMASRELLISFADVVNPGHGTPFRPRKSA